MVVSKKVYLFIHLFIIIKVKDKRRRKVKRDLKKFPGGPVHWKNYLVPPKLIVEILVLAETNFMIATRLLQSFLSEMFQGTNVFTILNNFCSIL